MVGKNKYKLMMSVLRNFFPFLYMSIKPTIAKIEPTNMCNSRCPLCPSWHVKEKGSMSLTNFMKVLDNLGDIKEVGLFLHG